MIIKIILCLLGLAYVLSPYDLFPDFFLGPGWIDDITVLFLLWRAYKYYVGRKKYGYSKEYRQSSSTGHDNNGQQKKREFTSTDPYDVLGVDRNASQDQIKSAYKKLAGKYHPDKVAHLGEEFRDLAEHRFKEIQEAYQRLKVKE